LIGSPPRVKAGLSYYNQSRLFITMTTTFTWAIAQLERETADGFVYTAHYTVNATDGEAYSAVL